MAWIEKKKRRSGHVVRWRELDGSVKSKSAGSLPEAKTIKAEVELKLLTGAYVNKDQRQQTFLDYLENVYAGDLSIRAVTRANYESVVRLHLEPRIGGLKLEDVTVSRMRKLFADLSRDTTPWTTSMAFRMVRRVASQAFREGLIPRDVMDGVRVPKPQRRQPRILTPAEVQSLCDSITPRYRALVLLSAWGGLSIGELGALQRSDLSDDLSLVTVDEAVSTPHGRAEIGPPKAAARRRTVAVPSWVSSELRKHILEFRSVTGFIFTTANDDIVTHVNIRRDWTAACKAAGITPAPRFHDLRHTAVALAIESGAHPKLIQSRLGHSSITMTMDTYGHLFPTADAELAAGLEKFRPTGEDNVVSL
jgi:integrase